ncbi:MAG: B12-binding domain-containing radical SAM protein [Saprospiraceae bacterium]|nr:B12-binding domain-containing radical SAM protein [Saprospiraceae bacterium]
MKIVFTHAYFLEQDPKEKVIMKPYPPLGILYLSAWLEKFGIENEVFDSTFSNPDKQRQYLLENQPDILAVYSNLMSKIQVGQLLHFIRNHPNLAKTLVVIGGPDVSHNIENYLGLGADIVVIGEGEQTMLEIAQAWKNGLHSQFGHVDGLAFRDEAGAIIQTNPRVKISDLETLPLPNRSKIDLQKYLDVWKKHHGYSTISVSTQRGCPYTCKWCSTAVYGQSYRRRTPKSVVDELAFLQKNYQADQIWFVDDVFTVSHKWLTAFRDEMVSRGINFPFECITRADRLNADVITILKEAGCFRVWIGAESGSQKILDAMDRRVDAQWVQSMIIEARKQGIEAGTFIMLGYPGETETDIVQTLDHLRKSNPDLYTITVAYPIKGTGLYEETQSHHKTPDDWANSTDRQIDFTRTYPRKYYDFAVRWVVNSIQLHKLHLNNKKASISYLKTSVKVVLSKLGMSFYKWSVFEK